MRVTVHHDAVADTIAKHALTVKTFEHEIEMLDVEAELLSAAWDREAQRSYDRAGMVRRDREHEGAAGRLHAPAYRSELYLHGHGHQGG